MAGTVLSPVPGRSSGGRRAAALVACMAVLVAACNNASSPGADGGTDVTVGDGIFGGGTDGDGNDPGGEGGGDNGATPTTKAPSGVTTTTARGSSNTTRPTGGSRTGTPAESPDSGARRGPGAFARTILRPEPATRVVVELLVQPGAAPRQGTVDHLRQVLGEVTGKPVTITAPVDLPATEGRTSDDEIRAMADRYGSPQSSGQAVVHLLFLRGSYEEDGVLGVAVRGDTAAIFSDTVRSASTPLVGAAAIEDAVTTHEMGHLLGLVDIVLKTGREDPEHPGHSRNRDSVMYWAVEASIVAQVLGGPPPRNFDSADKADLAAIRNGA